MTHNVNSEVCRSEVAGQFAVKVEGTIGLWDLGLREPHSFSLRNAVPPELHVLVDTILAPYRRTANEFFDTIIKEMGTQIPLFWTLVLFEREVPLVDHFLQARKDAALYKGVVFVMKKGKEDTTYSPCLGGVLLLDKAIAEATDPSDELMYRIWDIVRRLDLRHRWCVFANAPNETWITDHVSTFSRSKNRSWFGYYYKESFSWDRDPGVKTIANAYGPSLNVNAKWSMCNERGFVWWPHDYEQIVRSAPGILDHGAEYFRVMAVSNFVINAQAHPEDVLAAISRLLSQLSGSSVPIYDQSDGSVQLCTTCWVHEGNVEWLMRDFGAFAAMQIADTERFAESFAKEIRGEPDRTRHPVNGTRVSPDEMLTARDTAFRVPLGWLNNWFMPPVLLPVMEILKQNNSEVRWEKDGFSTALPYNRSQTSKLDISCKPHPELGEGCWLTLTLPCEAACGKIIQAANQLNKEEFHGASLNSLIGGWTALDAPEKGIAKLAFVSFLPNLLFGQGKLESFVSSMVIRARWASGLSNILADALQESANQASRLVMMRVADIERFAKESGVPMLTPDHPLIKSEGSSIEGKTSLDFALRTGILSKRDD
ncbi:MAG: hypothetical protein WAZ31_04825 [Rectinemataceae bacterium]